MYSTPLAINYLSRTAGYEIDLCYFFLLNTEIIFIFFFTEVNTFSSVIRLFLCILAMYVFI